MIDILVKNKNLPKKKQGRRFMIKTSNNKKLIVAFICCSLLSVTLLYFSYVNVVSTRQQSENIVKEQQAKHRFITEMYMAARERSILLLTMHAKDDVFELDELNMQMSEHATKFIRARQMFELMGMNDTEKTIYAEIVNNVKLNALHQNQVGNLFVEDKYDEAEKLMFEVAIPGQKKILVKIIDMLKYYDENTEQYLIEVDNKYISANRLFISTLCVIVVTLILFVFGAYNVSRRERKKLQDTANEMTYFATHDSLTNLSNRRAFESSLKRLIANQGDSVNIVLYLDLDQFKIINDSCGHHAGDQLLKRAAMMIKACVRDTDLVSRIGGDEFGIILRSCNLKAAELIADNILQTFKDYHFYWKKKAFHVGVSIGLVRVSGCENTVEGIMQQIDSACYAAKETGGSRCEVYSKLHHEIAQRKSEMCMATRIENALEHDLFELYAQPITAINNDDKQLSYEILIRMKSAGNKLIAPTCFLPAAERYRKITAIDQWVIKNTFLMLSNQPSFLLSLNYCSINISGQSLTDKDFFSFVSEQLSLYDDIANKICFEITETAAISNPQQAKKCISGLKNMGIRFALDDFGSGLASFEYLKTLNVDFLKIDGMFIKDIVNNPVDRVMIQATQSIANVMNLITIAEYVEDNEILNVLRTIGVHYAQGYGIGLPAPLHSIITSFSAVSSDLVMKQTSNSIRSSAGLS